LTQYVGIRSEGGLIPYDVLDKIAKEEPGLGQQAKDFGLASGRRLTDEIARAWSDAQDYWHIFQRRTASLPVSETGTTLTRKWISDLLNEQLLGYELTFQPSGSMIGGKNYAISHRAGSGEESPPVQIEGFRIDLDTRGEGRRVSPQALVQQYLNNSDSHLWGIVTNGKLLRLLRDTSRTSRPSYLEFDLESILEGNRFNEFALFYRVCHRSRLPRTAEDSTSCWLEKYFQISVEQGGRVRDKLRDGVEDALKTLGTGLLRHPNNDALRERVKAGTLTAAEFHRQLLRLVYRLLFLMVAEERRMIVPESPEADRRQRLYESYYSVGRLRTLAEKAIELSTFGDLWMGLQQTFVLFEDGDSNPLGIPPLNGDLFSSTAVKDLQGTHIYNDELLAAVQRLSLFEDHRVRQRVNYSALDVEELGSVYESLLDFQPVITHQPEGMRFELPIGGERKSTGSYYTRPELVRELIESALVPVMQDRLAAAKDSDPAKEKEKKKQAILSMSVCDPACGSGHFLLAAARRLGRELAKIRMGEDEPTPKEFHLAVRDVIAHCIYGVDVNPLAVDLCKLALWLEGHWTGKPLSFLDHRIKWGNSLVGVMDMNVLRQGIPDEAYNAVFGDEKRVATAFRRRNREEQEGQSRLVFDADEHIRHYASASETCADIQEESPADVKRKKEAYDSTRGKPDWWHDWVAANLLTAAFFAPLANPDDSSVPTSGKLIEFLQANHVDGLVQGAALGLASEIGFFHWQLEFPEVFRHSGFSVVLGNPPWEKIKLLEQEFWAGDQYIVNSRNQSERRLRIEEYRKSSDPGKCGRAIKFDQTKHEHDAVAKFARFSGRFPLTAVGDINTYGLFAELAWRLIGTNGRVGLLVPTGIVTDEGSNDFFAEITKERALVSLFDFENREAIFPGVHRSYKFSAITLTGDSLKETRFAFYLTEVNQLHDAARNFTLSPDELRRFSPNTFTCPVFRTKQDSQLARKLYLNVPVLHDLGPDSNSSGIELRRMLHMSEDSHMFISEPREGYVPLYEAKMFHQFDHRWATVENGVSRECNEGEKESVEFSISPRYWAPRREVLSKISNVPPVLLQALEHDDEKALSEILGHWLASYLRAANNKEAEEHIRTFIRPSIWQSGQGIFADFVRQEAIIENWQQKWPLAESDLRLASTAKEVKEFAWSLVESKAPKWLIAFRGIARSTDERTAIFSFIPSVGIGHSAPLLFATRLSPRHQCCLLGNLNSLVFDYLTRQRVGGANFSFFILGQVPVLPPRSYLEEDEEYITTRVAELVYTASDLGELGKGLERSTPYKWGVDRRLWLRAELDAYYAHLYGLTRDELRFILNPKDVFGADFPSETFRVLKEREEKEFGEYRTRRLVLEAFDKLTESCRFRKEVHERQSALNTSKSEAQATMS
jgi:hypothetical protein